MNNRPGSFTGDDLGVERVGDSSATFGNDGVGLGVSRTEFRETSNGVGPLRESRRSELPDRNSVDVSLSLWSGGVEVGNLDSSGLGELKAAVLATEILRACGCDKGIVGVRRVGSGGGKGVDGSEC